MEAGSHRRASQGYLLAVARNGGRPGEITLHTRAEGLPFAQIRLQAS